MQKTPFFYTESSVSYQLGQMWNWCQHQGNCMYRESKKLTKASLEIHLFFKLWFLRLWLLWFSVIRGPRQQWNSTGHGTDNGKFCHRLNRWGSWIGKRLQHARQRSNFVKWRCWEPSCLFDLTALTTTSVSLTCILHTWMCHQSHHCRLQLRTGPRHLLFPAARNEVPGTQPH